MFEFIVDAKATDSFRDRNLSANYSCGLLRLRLESDWSQNNKHSRNNFRRSWFNGFHCKPLFVWLMGLFFLFAYNVTSTTLVAIQVPLVNSRPPAVEPVMGALQPCSSFPCVSYKWTIFLLNKKSILFRKFAQSLTGCLIPANKISFSKAIPYNNHGHAW